MKPSTQYQQFKTKSLTGDIVETVIIILPQMILIIPTDWNVAWSLISH